MSYRELDDEKYLRWQRRLLKGTSEAERLEGQQELLRALLEPGDFERLVGERVGETEGENLPVLDGPLTEASFREPTGDQEERMFDGWRDIRPVVASRVSFWGSVTLNHVREGKIRSATWLAADGTNARTGEERVEIALRGPEEGRAATMAECVRTVFRRLSGLPIFRGNRSVFVNPPFGRGWWRERVVQQCSHGGPQVARPAEIRAVVRCNQEYWETLVTLIVSRGSVFGSLAVQSALIQCLAVRFRANPNTLFRNATELKSLLRRFSRLAAAREFGILPAAEIRGELETLMDGMENGASRAA